MEHFRLKRSIVQGESLHEKALREFGRYDDVPPVDIHIERFDRAIAGLAKERTIVPNGLTVEEICEFMNHAAEGK